MQRTHVYTLSLSQTKSKHLSQHKLKLCIIFEATDDILYNGRQNVSNKGKKSRKITPHCELLISVFEQLFTFGNLQKAIFPTNFEI